VNKDLVDVIQIDDPQIDAAEVARRVQETLFAHGLDKEHMEFPEFTVVLPPLQDGTRFPATLHHDLEQAARSCSQTWVELQPVESPNPFLSWQSMILGGWG
jgi:hypothetical protein